VIHPPGTSFRDKTAPAVNATESNSRGNRIDVTLSRFLATYRTESSQDAMSHVGNILANSRIAARESSLQENESLPAYASALRVSIELPSRPVAHETSEISLFHSPSARREDRSRDTAIGRRAIKFPRKFRARSSQRPARISGVLGSERRLGRR